MNYSLSFGKLTAPARPWRGPGSTFAVFVLGDFSGRANRGVVEVGNKLAARKPRRVDIDNIDTVLASMTIEMQLAIGDEGGTTPVKVASLDDFHPDQLYESVECFAELAELRRRLAKGSSFAAAAEEVREWLASSPASGSHSRGKARGAAIPNAKMSDFSRLIGENKARKSTATPIDELLKQVVRPYVSADIVDDQSELLEAIDTALSGMMRKILHHPDFQAMESIWRSVDLLVRELETDNNLQIVLYDISAEELAADLASAEKLEDSGLYQLLVEQPALDTRTAPPAVVVGCYQFELTPPHAELLGRVAKVAAVARAPFVAAIGNDVLEKKKPEDIHPLVASSWKTLRELPHAAYLGLTVPRFMLRWPYGAKTEPIDPFEFEEFTPQFGLKGFLWGNAAVLVGLMLGRTFSQQGLAGMKLGTIMVQGNLPLYYFVDSDGDQVALPCTERLATESVAALAVNQGFIPVLWLRGRNEVRLGGLKSLKGGDLAGPWGVVEIAPDSDDAVAAPAPEAAAAEPVAAAPAPVAAAPAPADEAADDVDLDALFDDLADSSSPAPAATDDGGDDLDALLASLEAPSEPAEGDGEMDPDLAALLAEL